MGIWKKKKKKKKKGNKKAQGDANCGALERLEIWDGVGG